MKYQGTFNFADVNFIVGTRRMDGFEEGSEIMVKRKTDSFTVKTDLDGNVTRSRSNDKTGEITITLSQYSSSNGYLQNLANIDERTGAGVVPIKMTERKNQTKKLLRPSGRG